jgi:hypothetical protein
MRIALFATCIGDALHYNIGRPFHSAMLGLNFTKRSKALSEAPQL